MRRWTALRWLLLPAALEITLLVIFCCSRVDDGQDVAAVNEVVKMLETHWQQPEAAAFSPLDYTVLGRDGTVRYQTREGLSETIPKAIARRDTILDLWQDDQRLGQVLIHNSTNESFAAQRRWLAGGVFLLLLVQTAVLFGSYFYLEQTYVRPFQELKQFAVRVAGGNLELPLTMDRKNIFGAFTESFDLMRRELAQARLMQARADREKKELVAKLSHDIKTPVASIKAVAELGYACAGQERIRGNYEQIIRKADQINALISNLFTAALEELQQLTVTPVEFDSSELKNLLHAADYLQRGTMAAIPQCLLWGDLLRLQQVLDNLFVNAYKYADTQIEVTAFRQEDHLRLVIEDFGGGVSDEELGHLKEKFWRGSSHDAVEGAGLGLFLSDYFMKEMQGALLVENGRAGLKVSVVIALGGMI